MRYTLITTSAAIFLFCATLVAPVAWAAAKSTIVPDVTEEGRRGDIARKQRLKAARRFLASDEDADGLISLTEAELHLPFMGRNFDRYDVDGNGELTWQEFVRHDHWPAPDPVIDAPVQDAPPLQPAADNTVGINEAEIDEAAGIKKEVSKETSMNTSGDPL